MGGEQDIPALLQAEPPVHIRGLDPAEVPVQHLRHGRAGHIGALSGQPAVRQIPAGMLGIRHVHIGDDVHDPAVGLFRQTLILAAVAGLHVEDGDVEALGPDDGQAGIGISQHQDGVRPQLRHQVVGSGDDVPHGLAQGVSHGIQADLRGRQLQVPEKDAVQIVVVVLAGMGQEAVKVLPALLDDRRQADDLRPGAHDDEQLQFAVVLKRGHGSDLSFRAGGRGFPPCLFPVCPFGYGPPWFLGAPDAWDAAGR